MASTIVALGGGGSVAAIAWWSLSWRSSSTPCSLYRIRVAVAIVPEGPAAARVALPLLLPLPFPVARSESVETFPAENPRTCVFKEDDKDVDAGFVSDFRQLALRDAAESGA